jgi:hypothetical protein
MKQRHGKGRGGEGRGGEERRGEERRGEEGLVEEKVLVLRFGFVLCIVVLREAPKTRELAQRPK